MFRALRVWHAEYCGDIKGRSGASNALLNGGPQVSAILSLFSCAAYSISSTLRSVGLHFRLVRTRPFISSDNEPHDAIGHILTPLYPDRCLNERRCVMD